MYIDRNIFSASIVYKKSKLINLSKKYEISLKTYMLIKFVYG